MGKFIADQFENFSGRYLLGKESQMERPYNYGKFGGTRRDIFAAKSDFSHISTRGAER